MRMMKRFDVPGQVAVVTAASSGIDRPIAETRVEATGRMLALDGACAAN